jgi:hypothetical protein
MSGGWYWGQKRCMGKLWNTLGIVLIFVLIKSGHMRSDQISHITNNFRVSHSYKNDPRFLLRSTKYPEEPVQILRSPNPSSRLMVRLFGTRGTVQKPYREPSSVVICTSESVGSITSEPRTSCLSGDTSVS